VSWESRRDQGRRCASHQRFRCFRCPSVAADGHGNLASRPVAGIASYQDPSIQRDWTDAGLRDHIADTWEWNLASRRLTICAIEFGPRAAGSNAAECRVGDLFRYALILTTPIRSSHRGRLAGLGASRMPRVGQNGRQSCLRAWHRPGAWIKMGQTREQPGRRCATRCDAQLTCQREMS
jgi:hypothetical protein